MTVNCRTVAWGAASRTCTVATPDVTIPRLRSPSIRGFSPEISFQAAIRSSLSRSRTCAGRAYAGTITRAGMSRSKCGSCGGLSSGTRRMMVLEWQTRVVMRRMTGMENRSDSAKAMPVSS